jgi:hypothetical protein
MKLLERWKPQFRKDPVGATRETERNFEAAQTAGLNDLQARLSHWSHLWGQEGESALQTEAQELVAKRLSGWMERCFGQHVQGTLRSKGGQISLASSTPIFTAFLGRRATRELSRRVLQDI